MSKIELKSIGEIANSDMHFFIPNYQRGYRWEVQQVEDLLNDILEFQQNGSNGIYCIQPLVVKGHPQENAIAEIREMFTDVKQPSDDIKEKCKTKKWEVIDGQQRLTTVHILLSCLNADKYSLEYATREKSSVFLNNIVQHVESDEGKEEKDRKYNSNIDFFHMYQAYDTISKWIGKFDTKSQESLKKTVLEKVRFIWYETEEPNPIKVFTRLNIGKIPLTDAELVKALFLNESNFSGLSNSNAIRLQQQEIAAEWDRIEFTLQNDEFWLFIHDTEWDKPTRIDFILDLIREKDSLQLKNSWIDNYRKKYPGKEDDAEKEWVKCIGTDKHQTFRYFYEYFIFYKLKIQNGEIRLRDDVWRKIKNVFQIFNEWFNDLEMYHYIGFLVETGTVIKNLISAWDNSSKSKDFFLDGLKGKIKDNLKNKKCQDLNREYELDNKRDCIPLLLLFNIQTIINQSHVFDKKFGTHVFYKFPFHLYKSEPWDVEHIDSETTNECEDEASQQEFLINQYLGVEEDKQEKIRKYLSTTQHEQGSFDSLIQELNLPEHQEFNKNQVWNYTLLDSTTNRSYGNAIFAAKRRIIIGKDQGKKIPIPSIKNGEFCEGKEAEADSSFVPPCTKHIFMKYYSVVSSSPTEYTETDAKAYKKVILDTLKKFGVTDTNTKSGENK